MGKGKRKLTGLEVAEERKRRRLSFLSYMELGSGFTELGTGFSVLPPDHLLELVSRFDVQSVARCRSLNKDWNKLMCSFTFLRSHFEKLVLGSQVRKTAPCPGLMMCECENYSRERALNYYFLDLMSDERFGVISRVNFAFSYKTRVRGCDRGVLLLSGQNLNEIVLCNPVTREALEIPNPRPLSRINWSMVGFGVSSTGEGHVVLLVNRETMIYSLSTRTWAGVDLGKVDCIKKSPVVVPFAGCLHWMKMDTSEILSLELSSLTVRTFKFPPFDNKCLAHLFTSLGYLYFSESPGVDYGNCITVWRMNVHGDDSTWVPQFQIDAQPGFPLSKFWPIQVFTNGDALLLRFRSGVVIFYDSSSKTFHYMNEQLQTEFDWNKQEPKGLICLPYTPCFKTIISLVGGNNWEKDGLRLLVGHFGMKRM
ncbi:uncharacterized protein LOC125207597 [Salvia hispanica]|uniref:uncharacterized protein LOC125207597 n=1 Tax=Salvia hispanica TaxID=49212 RepID=UPI00200902A5|nr:uncharacterized protein LOC125207597 [Salvia hispanica]XP_047962959.1 uncharacterized protein LOC125207597 [Salvia hispanica]XP_047962960.1 uncharacterized protein LOC125207597 [Salvia hispanica]